MDWKNLVERALWTFLEAFLVALPSTITMEVPAAGWVSVLLSAACAGLSAVKTLLVEWVSRKVDTQKAEKPPDVPTEIM